MIIQSMVNFFKIYWWHLLQMLSIHERRECGIPVIIEGETGVGKTALISMLSKLWNHALNDELRTLKDNIREMLLYKSLGVHLFSNYIDVVLVPMYEY